MKKQPKNKFIRAELVNFSLGTSNRAIIRIVITYLDSWGGEDRFSVFGDYSLCHFFTAGDIYFDIGNSKMHDIEKQISLVKEWIKRVDAQPNETTLTGKMRAVTPVLDDKEQTARKAMFQCMNEAQKLEALARAKEIAESCGMELVKKPEPEQQEAA